MLNNAVAVFAAPVPPVTNSYESISTVTLSGAASSITFSSIPSTYKHLQIRGVGQTSRGTYGNDQMTMRVGNGSVDSGNNYSHHMLSGDGSNASATGTANNNIIDLSYKLGTTTSGAFGAFIIDILDYADTNKYKTVRNLAGVDINGLISGYGGEIELSSGSWRSFSAINTITLYPNFANFTQYTKFALYGIKG